MKINVGFLGLLTLLFIGLKLGDVIVWSWWWVLCPLWAPFALLLAVVIFILVFGLFVGLVAYVCDTVKK